MYPFIALSPQLQISTYLLIISLVYSYSLFWVVKRAQKRKLPFEETLNLSLCIMVGGFLGARILHILYEEPHFYLDHPMEIFKFWNGGFVYYGGALGAALLTWLWVKYKKLSYFQWADLFTPVFALGYGMGRLACFFNGCCYGKSCDLPWALQFKNLPGSEALLYRHPTQLYAFLWALALTTSILVLEKKATAYKWFQKPGQIFLFWLFFHGVGRVFMESFRDDFRGESILGLSVSTWISLSLMLVSSHFFYHRGKKR